tara:strand:- start:300 stop:692 length:393 start_codon:yes stop_codon:yes gene_type:complete
MEKEFISYEQASELKELGFDYKTNSLWVITKTQPNPSICFSSSWINHNEHEKFISAPLYQQAFKFFREKHGMHAKIGFNGFWFYDIDSMKNTEKSVYEVSHKWDMKTYEEAEQACLEKLIEIVKLNEDKQ